jgi:hypothetical protein
MAKNFVKNASNLQNKISHMSGAGFLFLTWFPATTTEKKYFQSEATQANNIWTFLASLQSNMSEHYWTDYCSYNNSYKLIKLSNRTVGPCLKTELRSYTLHRRTWSYGQRHTMGVEVVYKPCSTWQRPCPFLPTTQFQQDNKYFRKTYHLVSLGS